MAYIGNTTFVVERGLEGVFREWACGTLVKAARESRHFTGVRLLKILTEVDPAAVNYALQLESHDSKVISDWISDVAMFMLDDLRQRVANNVLFFMTEMEVVDDD